MTQEETKKLGQSLNVEKEWLEILEILILYKFANKGTSESTADKIYNLFINKVSEEKT